MKRFGEFFCLMFVLFTILFLYGCGGGARGVGGGSLLDGTNRSVTTIVVHHTAGMASNDIKQVVSGINRLHARKFRKMGKSLGLTIAYHYLITPDGKVWRTRDLQDVGYHAGDWNVNLHSIGVCLVGDFTKYRPTKSQVRSLDRLVRRLRSERRISKVIPHSYCRATLCCGEHLKREVRRFSWGKHF